jgi:serine/threonine-protein kinase
VIDPHTSSGGGASGTRSSKSDLGSGASKVEVVGQGNTSYTGPSALFTSSASTPSGESRSRRGLLAGALLAGAVLAVGGWLATRSQAQGPVVATTGQAPVDKAPATAVPLVNEIEIAVSATPPEAKIFLDDKPQPGNPIKSKLTKDGVAHQLRVEAPGYTTRTDVLTFERDHNVDVVLVKDTSDRSRHPAPTGPVAPPPDDSMTRPGVKKQRPLDTSNPYKQ